MPGKSPKRSDGVKDALVILMCAAAAAAILGFYKQNTQLRAEAEDLHRRVARASFPVGTALPAASVSSPAGTYKPLEELVREGAVLIFFTTRCPLCETAVPTWLRIENEARRRGVAFVAVSLDSVGKTTTFAKAKQFDFPVWILMHEAAVSPLAVPSVPLTLALSAGGVVQGLWLGEPSPGSEADVVDAAVNPRTRQTDK